mmetsp:Transcript_14739/g.23218  ORF Transcript_14739/g.23218 Transcript_14739/m.23218 type:complete len:350 (+) Transcript_14739:269-1318(+)
MEISFSILSSTNAPKMIFALGSTASYITSAAELISCNVMSCPPVILKTIPLALSIGKSKRGELIAATAASWALVFPEPVPIPIKALPASAITERTSAKSTFIKPGLTIISEIPTTPCLRMSSATENASWRGVLSGTICKSLSLETTIRVSTLSRRLAIASVACCILLRPSNAKGLVTTPTVKHPISLATSATTGAAPDPVPPPIPAVTKTKSPAETASPIRSRLSSAAFLPISGFPPAPRPLVNLAPILHVLGAKERDKACASVLMDQNSTPSTPPTIRLTAFPPPPPTPITLITQGELPPSGCIEFWARTFTKEEKEVFRCFLSEKIFPLENFGIKVLRFLKVLLFFE